MITRGRKAEDRELMFVCRTEALLKFKSGRAATRPVSSACRLQSSETGFTLVEMIVVMVITGIIGGIVAMFIKAPVQGYVDSARRAELTDIADTALRRLARDIRTAVPNSVRPSGNNTYIEFIPTKDGGRYRGNTPGDVLDFGVEDGSFDIVGRPINFASRDRIVVGSTQSSGIPPYDSSAAGVLRTYLGSVVSPQSTVVFSATALPVWAEVQGRRFDVVDATQEAVTYACLNVGTNSNGNGTGTLTRYWLYGFTAAQQLPAALGGLNAVLADKVSACEFIYDAVNQRNGLLAIRLGLSSGGESVSLYHTIHVNNVP